MVSLLWDGKNPSKAGRETASYVYIKTAFNSFNNTVVKARYGWIWTCRLFIIPQGANSSATSRCSFSAKQKHDIKNNINRNHIVSFKSPLTAGTNEFLSSSQPEMTGPSFRTTSHKGEEAYLLHTLPKSCSRFLFCWPKPTHKGKNDSIKQEWNIFLKVRSTLKTAKLLINKNIKHTICKRIRGQ